MKKQICTALSVLCLMALAGCGAGGKPQNSSPADAAGSDSASGGFSVTFRGSAHSEAGAGGSAAVSDNNSTAGPEDTSAQPDKDAGADAATEPVVWQLRIVDGAESGSLVLAGENAGQVYSLSVKNVPVTLDGEPAEAAALQDGMMIDVVFDGMIMETYPGQMGSVYEIRAYSRGSEQNPGGEYFDLCGLYLQVLNDLWDKDPGLNSKVLYVSLDLSQAPGNLTEGEKSAMAWIFAGQHGVDALMLSQKELAEQGYLTEVSGSGDHKLYQWEDGILFTVTPGQWDEDEFYSLPVLKFDVQKWRSPLGAYYFKDCSAIWPEVGTWTTYNIGSELIS